MFLLAFLALIFLVAQPCDIPGAPLPPGITPKKAEEGWIALFDGKSTYGWKTVGHAKLNNGVLTMGGEQEASLTSTTHFASFEFVMSYRLEGKEGGFQFTCGDKQVGKKETTIAPSNEFKDFTLGMPNNSKTGSITITTNPGTTLHIKSITLKPLGAKSIFNGKDLSGWKEIPGRKSKFSVTSNGELNVKDGNGDLQTIDQWDDFVLQMDIISNGDHLNSGVFFRSLPGEFWSGYEAQVRNEWNTTVKLKDGTSITGSLTFKGDDAEVKAGRQSKKFKRSDIESMMDHRDKPIDFGSGGIYHHCPARTVVTTDRQWYTMTVIAHGNHIAVWVNGYQTAEFTDNRPVNKSARRGRKDDAGCLSIQGHDPTTDLSFRNIRIAALPK
ncbi:MAG: DUF1080 domain-containing protein [Planctomycetia bacterium]|nr:DUF1080 domain-containing protein [Planctomycetia bacterium]